MAFGGVDWVDGEGTGSRGVEVNFEGGAVGLKGLGCKERVSLGLYSERKNARCPSGAGTTSEEWLVQTIAFVPPRYAFASRFSSTEASTTSSIASPPLKLMYPPVSTTRRSLNAFSMRAMTPSRRAWRTAFSLGSLRDE